MFTTHSLSPSRLIDVVYQSFHKIKDSRTFSGKPRIRLVDHMMCGLAIFGLKFPSLLKYDRDRSEPVIEQNLKALYHVHTPPSDTYLRERLDQVDTHLFRDPFKKIFAKAQRHKVLEDFAFMNGYYLLALDGTGKFSSSNVCCEHSGV